jgi:hypothetical protein
MSPPPTSRYRGPIGPDRIVEYWSWVAWALFLLVTVDMLTTLFAASVLGTAAEANPLMRWALERGLGTLLALNLAAVVFVVAFFYGLVQMLERTPERYQSEFSLVVEVWLGLLLFVGLAVFANNLSAIFLGQSLL